MASPPPLVAIPTPRSTAPLASPRAVATMASHQDDEFEPLPHAAVDSDLEEGEEEKYNSPVEDSDAEEEEEQEQSHPQQLQPNNPIPVVQQFCGDLWGDGSAFYASTQTIGSFPVFEL